MYNGVLFATFFNQKLPRINFILKKTKNKKTTKTKKSFCLPPQTKTNTK